jgi:hypothetical protein
MNIKPSLKAANGQHLEVVHRKIMFNDQQIAGE